MQLYPEEDLSNAKATLSDLSEIIEQARIRCGIPGMGVTVLYKGEIVFSEGFGKRNLHDPFTPEVWDSNNITFPPKIKRWKPLHEK
jgi:hypothetical protein